MSTEPEPSPAQFPPLEWLGYGLDLTRLNPFDFISVGTQTIRLRSVLIFAIQVYKAKTQVRIVDVTKDTRTHTVTIGISLLVLQYPFLNASNPGGVEYQIPRAVGASEENSTVATARTFSDGTLAAKALKDDFALAYRLLPVTTNNNSFFPLDKSLPAGSQFYFFVNDYDSYSGRLNNFLDFINEEELLTHVSKLSPFDSENPDVVQDYIGFFNTVGSHFVSTTGFGARFQLVGLSIPFLSFLLTRRVGSLGFEQVRGGQQQIRYRCHCKYQGLE